MTTLLETLVEEIAPLKTALSEAEPAGSDCSYDPLFDELKAEVDKLSSLAGDKPDWKKVEASADQLIREKTKDMRVLSWYALASAHTGGARGAAKGLLAIKEVTEQHWEQMFPAIRRLRARANLIEWMNEHLTGWAQGWKPTVRDREALTALEQIQSDLDAAMAEKLVELHPGMGTLRSALRDKSRQMPAERKPTPAASEAAQAGEGAAEGGDGAAAEARKAAPVPAPAARSVSGAAGVLPALSAVSETILQAAAALRKDDPADAWAYQLQRLGAWLPVKAPPPDEASKTLIPPPDEQDMRSIEVALKGEQWLALLETAEKLTGAYIFWFDLHRLVALAMDRLGALFMTARTAVGRNVIGFVQQYPAIPTLSFASGMPFAEPATKSWLDEEAARLGSGGGSGGASQAGSEEDAELAARFEEAKKLVTTGKAADGLALAVQLAARGADARTRFRSKLAVARLVVQASEPTLAAPVFASLIREAEEHQLDSWEPGLCVELYSSFLGSLPAKEAKQDPVFARLASIDPASALKIASG